MSVGNTKTNIGLEKMGNRIMDVKLEIKLQQL
jgi:hypothetical protein